MYKKIKIMTAETARSIDPKVNLELYIAILEKTIETFAASGKYSFSIPEEMCERDNDGRYVIPKNIENDVRSILEEAGYTIKTDFLTRIYW